MDTVVVPGVDGGLTRVVAGARGPVAPSMMIHTIIGEIQTVVATMRNNSRFSAFSHSNPLLRDFKGLRSLLANLHQSAEVDICACLKPFLTVIRSEETSGPITGVALISVYKFIVYGFIDVKSPSAAKAMSQIADTVTHCRFEVTNPDVDDVVLMKILRVLLACLCCPAGVLLTDDLVCEMVQTCYRMTTQGRICELLRKTAEHAIMEIVHVLFLIDRRHAHRVLDPAEGDLSAASIGRAPAMENTYVNPQGVRFHKPGEDNAMPPENKPYGKGALVRVFAFLCSLVNPNDSRHTESIHVLGLQLLTSIVEAQADLILDTPAILSLTTNEMCKFLLQSLTTQSLDVLNLVMRLFFNLYIALRKFLKVHVEVFFSNLLSQILENEGPSFEMREVAMEHLVQFVSQPDFITDIYVNYDCHLHCTDLFVNLTKFLCKSSFPVEGVLYSTQLLSLEALLGILHIISKRCDSKEDALDRSRPVTAEDLRHSREEKAKMLAAAEIFNGNVKECIAHLKTIGILPDTEETDPVAFAHFLRHCPGLKKELVGEFIGGAKNTAILNAYLDTFDFTDVPLIASIRQYLTAFFFKGEGQALERILDAFSQRWVTNNPNDTYISDADMACVLSYSIVILNVDAHNTQIKEKMTVAQYVKMWGHANKETSTVPDELLRQYYLDITQNEIKIHDDSPSGEVTAERWPALLRAAEKRGPFVSTSGRDIDKDMFKIIGKWIVASLSAVWENLNEAGLSLLLAGFKDCATIAAHHQLSDLFDTTVTHLCKFTTLLTPPQLPVKKAAAVFGTNWRAQLATKTVFSIASCHGDHFREAWRYVLRCITSLHAMALTGDLVEDHDTFEALKTKVDQHKKVEDSSSGGSMFSLLTGGWFSSEPVPEATPEDTEAAAAASRCVEECKIKELLETARDLQADSLVYLIKALRRESSNTHANQEFNEDVACFCLDLLTNIVLSNEHRVSFVWVLVYEHFTGLVQMATKPQPLVEKAIVCLLLLCVNLVHKEEVRVGVLNSLDLVLRLNPSVATAMAESIAIACSKLISTSIDFLSTTIPAPARTAAGEGEVSDSDSVGGRGTERENCEASPSDTEGKEVNGWSVVLGILTNCAAHPMAHIRGLGSIQTLLANEANTRLVYQAHVFPLFLQTVKVFIARCPHMQQGGKGGKGTYTTSSPLLPRAVSPVGGAASGSALASGSSPVLRSSSGSIGSGGQAKPLCCRTLDVLYFLFENAERVPSPAVCERELWEAYRLPIMRALCYFCADGRNELRNYAMGMLQRTLLCPYIGSLFVDGLRDCFTHVLFPLLRVLLQPLKASTPPVAGSRSQDSQDETRVRAVTLLSKFLLQNLMLITQLDDFHTKLWPEILDMIALYTKADQSGLLAETIPETLKNMLLIMFQSGAFQCTKTIGGVDVWTYSWTKINSFCPVLQNDESFRASLRSFQRPSGLPPSGSASAPPGLVQTSVQSPQPARNAAPLQGPLSLPAGILQESGSPLSASAPNLTVASGGESTVLFQDVVVGAPGSPTNI